MTWMKSLFRLLNKYLMVPIFRLGLGIFMGNPFTGYIMVLKTIGRKTGKVRYTPVNYAIIKGNIYCLAGFGPQSHWFLNLKANPDNEVLLPGGAIFGRAEEVADPLEGLRAVKQVIKNAGFAGFLEGYNPYRATDDQFLKTLAKAPVIRIQQIGVGNGPADPQGWLWLSMTAITLVLILVFLLK